MRRSVTDLIRRGLDSMLANWPLILIRLAEGLVMVAIFVGLIVATIVPLFVAAGLSKIDWESMDGPEVILDFLYSHVMLFVWIFVVISIGLLIFVAVHSFVEAGAAQVMLDADVQAGDAPLGPRSRFAAFSAERWLGGGRRGWWTVFWIYNIAWTIAGLIILIPLLFVLAGLLLIHQPVASLVVGCLALVVTAMFGFVLLLVTNIVTVKAIVDALAHDLGAMESLRAAWHEMRVDLGRHAGVAAILIVVSFAMAGIFAGANMSFPIHHHRMPPIYLLFAPMRIATSVVNAAVSSAIANWLLAAFAAIAREPRA